MRITQIKYNINVETGLSILTETWTKKLSIFLGILAVLIVALVVINNSKPDTVYGKPSDDLFQETRAILNDPNYNNIIIPDKLDDKIANKESFFDYYFASDCPHCKVTTPQLKPVADELGTRHLYSVVGKYEEIMQLVKCYCGCMEFDDVHTSLHRCYVAGKDFNQA